MDNNGSGELKFGSLHRDKYGEYNNLGLAETSNKFTTYSDFFNNKQWYD